MSKVVQKDKWCFSSIPEPLQELLIQLQRSEFCNYRNNFKFIHLNCPLCGIGNKSGRCTAKNSIGKMVRHVDISHQSTDIDSIQLKNEFLQFLKYLSIVINYLDGNYEFIINFLKIGVKGRIL
jgi:hypothetical protein